MRPLSALASLMALLGCGCAFQRLDDHAHHAACSALQCPALRQTRLRWWAFRVEGCGQVTYWRCALSQLDRCCWQVASERQAVRVTALAPPLAAQICVRDPDW